MNENFRIRSATIQDAAQLLEIYSPYVTDTAISFEYEIPSISEFVERIKQIASRYPYLVATNQDEIIGYAYASRFKERAAYDWAVETTVYLKHECQHKGVGRQLYTALEEALRKQNVLNLNACIAYSTVEDAYLNNTSTVFHEHMGYQHVGRFTKCGFKFGNWYDMIWMEKIIGEHPQKPEPFIPVNEL